MINERDIAVRFSSVWTQVFPLLTPNFMTKFNQTELLSITQNIKVVSKGHPDIVSEMAYNLSKLSHTKMRNVSEITTDPNLIAEAYQTSVFSIQRSSKDSCHPEEALAKEEIDEATLLANNIIAFIEMWTPKNITFNPKFLGYGVINECIGDLIIDDTLFEMKTVTRSFRSKDMKQLLLYLALQSVSSDPKCIYAGLYNPRTCQYCKFKVETLVKNLSGYDTSSEAFQDLLELFVREVQIDSRF